MELEINPPEKLAFFFDDSEHWRYKVAYGGRGSAKSWTVADALIALAFTGRKRILCAREFQRSIKDSVHFLLCDQIERLGLTSAFKITEHELSCSATGSQFIFAGLHHHVESLKSLEAIDVCWVEEAEVVSEASWSKLTPTIRKPGSEIWVTFNPDQESDPTYRRFVPGQPGFDAARTKSVQVSWRDNPQLPDVLKDELEHLRKTDPDAYAHVWEGGTWTRSDAQVFNGKWCIDEFAPDPHTWDGPYFGADWGFSQDPTVLLKLWIHAGRLYIEREKYGHGVDTAATPELFDQVEGSRAHKIRADCSRPETISAMVNAGFDCEGAAKWSGSVEDGIQFLRGFEKIVIAPSCKHFIQEARLYSYKTDRLTGDVLPILVDKHDHGWDAARYALQPIIKRVPEQATAVSFRFPT